VLLPYHMYMYIGLFPGVGDQSLMYESPLPLKSTRGGAASKGGGATKSKLLAAPQTGKGHKQVLKPQVSTRSRAALKSLTNTPQPQSVDSDEGW